MEKKYCAHVLIVTILIISTWGFSANSKDRSTTDLKFEHISIAEGLSQSTVYCVLQDSKGFMWFGTQHGLNRYDGNTFKLYDYDPRNPNSLSYNLVLSIYEDKSGMIWAGTWGSGLNKFDRETGKFTVFKKNAQDPESLSDDNINAIYEDRSGTLWIGTDNGLNQFDKTNGKCTHYIEEIKSSDDTQLNRIYSIFQDSEDNLWIGAERGLYKSNPDKTGFNICPVNFKKVEAINEDRYGILWVGTEGGLYIVERKDCRILPLSEYIDVSTALGDKHIRVIYKDKSGLFWIGSQKDGLYRFDPGKKIPIHYRSDPDNPDSLSHNDVRAICEDRTGLIWIGTNDGGADKFDPRRKKFTLYGNDPDNSTGFKNKKVWAIVECKRDGVWIGTREAGIYLFNPVSKRFTTYPVPSRLSNNPQRDSIRSMYEEKESDTLWVGTERAGLYRFDIETKQFSLFEKLKTDAYILSIYEDRSGLLWIGTKDDGLVRIDKDRKNIKSYKKNDPGRKKSLSGNEVFAICEDKQGVLWIGTGNGGLNRFDKEKESFRHYLPSENDPNSISYNFVLAIYEDTKGILWIGTEGGGLNKLIDREKGKFIAYRTTDGLPNNVIYAILEDEVNNLWLSTNKGLSRFDPKTGNFRNYTVRDGLQDYEFNRNAACKLKNSKELYFGGVKGFNVFNPVDLKTNSPAPPVVITSLKKNNNQEVNLAASTPGTRQVNLSYNDYSISFEFAALDFSDPGNNRYAYKLLPVSKEWIDLGNKHELTFPRLEPGGYTLRVTGSNNDGVWNEEGASVKIIVSTPFSATLLFKISLLLFIGGVIFGLVKWRIRDIEKKRKALRESEERYRTLVETSPDAITLCDIKGRIIMANQQTAILLGYKNLDEMRSHVRTIFNGITSKDRARARKNAEDVIKSGNATNSEFTLRAKDGIEIAAEISTSLITDSEGHPLYFLVITRDITERKEAEKKLMQAEKMASLGKLVSGVAHEINNPVSIIMSKAEAFSTVWKSIAPVLDRYEQDNKNFSIAGLSYKDIKGRLDESLNGLIGSSIRIKNIIQELSDFSRPEDPLSREAVDINKVIRSSLNLTNNMIKKATNKFSFEPKDNLPVVWGNYQRLERVFINLIRNACQALPDNSRGIYISTSYDNETNRIEAKVKDEGVGIDKENLKHISELFFTTKRTTGGTGLGLSISQQIIQEHGGKIEFESQVNKGTMVSVFLPAIRSKKND
jgi:PAS domain S-box-containing protein